MRKLILVDVPPRDMVFTGLQSQDRWFRGCALELKEERAHGTALVERHPRSPPPPSVGVRPNISVTFSELFAIIS